MQRNSSLELFCGVMEFGLQTGIADVYGGMSEESTPLRVVLVYQFEGKECEKNSPVPPHIVDVISLTTRRLSGHDAVFLSNHFECGLNAAALERLPNLVVVDSATVKSESTSRLFENARIGFTQDRTHALVTGVGRYFLLLDLLSMKKWESTVYMEVDTLLFTGVSRLQNTLASMPTPLTATMFSANLELMSAPIFFVRKRDSLSKLTEFMGSILADKKAFETHIVAKGGTLGNFAILSNMSTSLAGDPGNTATSINMTVDSRGHLSSMRFRDQPPGIPWPYTNIIDAEADSVYRDNRWQQFTTWLRPRGCCRLDGILPDHRRMGIRPTAVGDGSLLAYFHHLHPTILGSLPILPGPLPQRINTLNIRSMSNFSDFSLGGERVVRVNSNLDYIWDSGSWGQYMSGTARRKGRDKGFVDHGQIAGQALAFSQCRPTIACSSEPIDPSESTCRRVPYVYCFPKAISNTFNRPSTSGVSRPDKFILNADDSFIRAPLLDLHFASKNNVSEFLELFNMTRPCSCSDVAESFLDLRPLLLSWMRYYPQPAVPRAVPPSPPRRHPHRPNAAKPAHREETLSTASFLIDVDPADERRLSSSTSRISTNSFLYARNIEFAVPVEILLAVVFIFLLLSLAFCAPLWRKLRRQVSPSATTV